MPTRSDKVEPADATLLTPLAGIKGVRPAHADALLRLGVRTAADLIRHTPVRYERLEAEGTIAEVVPEQLVTVRGDVTATRVSGRAGRGNKARFEAVLVDPSGRLDLVWFNQPWVQQKVYPGIRLRVHGKARRYGPGLQIANPQIELLADEGADGALGGEPDAADARVKPVYPASEAINSGQIEAIVSKVLERGVAQIEDHLGEEFRRKRALVSLPEAYRMAHAPESLEQAQAARRRLAYDELLLLQLGVFYRRAQLRGIMEAPALAWSHELDARIRARFPFALTGAQEKVIKEIVGDLVTTAASNRLIQGDVGSGKTVVALYAMLLAVWGGGGGTGGERHQAAMMAPTEILAEQHYLSVSRMLEGSGVRVELLTGAAGQKEREGILSRTALGEVDILIGTHALLTETVRFRSLAVAVVDEQHRFGVEQRAVLRAKGEVAADPGTQRAAAAQPNLEGMEATPPPPPPPPLPRSSAGGKLMTPHVLVMTATPIPRTLALTLFGDLDVSTIDELPPGRTPIVTRVVSPAQSRDVYAYLRRRLEEGDQAYVVVPAIDTGASAAGPGGSGDAGLNDLRTVLHRLENGELMGLKLAALHGRLLPKTREQVMARFRAGLVQALVCTTVIEVGVDVPNATVMVIEHAERFGLAQLHQLRGRVGRGGKRSVCVLIGTPTTPDADSRLAVMAATTDGFQLAEEDMRIRGPGEVFGLRQAGAPPFRVADLGRDLDLLRLARRDAEGWIAASPTLDRPEDSLARKRLMRAHGRWLGLGDVG